MSARFEKRSRLYLYPTEGKVVEAEFVADVGRGGGQVRLVWTPQLPVVMVDVTPPTSTITRCSSKISSLKPNTLGSR